MLFLMNLIFFIISTKEDDKLGFFVFSKEVLLESGIISQESKGGKRGIRVYPTWCKTENKQAQKTQLWQCDYFLELTENKFNASKAKELIEILK
jgi:hypothetical protein